jgi:hypothetical protein
MHTPDPTLTASIYVGGSLHDLVGGAIVPFRDELRRHDPQGRWTLWMVRYTKCGTHLKLRLHGPEDERATVQRLLSEAFERYLASLEPVSPAEAAAPKSRPRSPAIDLEDEQSADYPERTLLWTHYRRSGVTLGPDLRLVADDEYASRSTACMAAAAEWVLDAVRPGLTESARLKVLLSALVAGITAVPLSRDERETYVAYHRDWLLRFMLNTDEREWEMRERLEGRVDAMAGVVDEARRALEAWDGGQAAEGTAAAWRQAVADVFAYTARLRGDDARIADPFSDDPTFPVLFKVFHGVRNQLGIDLLNEALVHQVLLRVLAGEPAAAETGD